jgi:outer membrane protein TolC
LQIAGVRVLGARAQLGAVVGELYPQTQKVVGELQKNRLSETSPLSAPGSPGNFWLSQLGLTAGWEIDFWGKFRRAIESADASLMAAEADYDNALVSLTGDVASSYILLRTLDQRLNIARQNVVVQKKSLRIDGALAGRHHLQAGRGAGPDGVGQHRGYHPHPGKPVSADAKRDQPAPGNAAQ